MTYGSHTWTEGARAARANVPVTANPHPANHYDFVVWLNGWAWAKHMAAKEEELEEL